MGEKTPSSSKYLRPCKILWIQDEKKLCGAPPSGWEERLSALWAKQPCVQALVRFFLRQWKSKSSGRMKPTVLKCRWAGIFFIWVSPKYFTCCSEWVFVFLLLLSSVSEGKKKNGFQFYNVPSLIDCSCVPVIYFHMLDCSTLSERRRGYVSAFRTFETFVSLLSQLGAYWQANWDGQWSWHLPAASMNYSTLCK